MKINLERVCMGRCPTRTECTSWITWISVHAAVILSFWWINAVFKLFLALASGLNAVHLNCWPRIQRRGMKGYNTNPVLRVYVYTPSLMSCASCVCLYPLPNVMCFHVHWTPLELGYFKVCTVHIYTFGWHFYPKPLEAIDHQHQIVPAAVIW